MSTTNDPNAGEEATIGNSPHDYCPHCNHINCFSDERRAAPCEECHKPIPQEYQGLSIDECDLLVKLYDHRKEALQILALHGIPADRDVVEKFAIAATMLVGQVKKIGDEAFTRQYKQLLHELRAACAARAGRRSGCLGTTVLFVAIAGLAGALLYCTL